MAIPGIAASFLGKVALGVVNKRKSSGGSAFPQMRTPKLSVVSSVRDLSARNKSRPTRASGSTIAKNQAMIGNIGGKGSIRMKAASGLTRI